MSQIHVTIVQAIVKILRCADNEYRYLYLLINKLNKEDLYVMYFCVFRCEFTALVDFLAPFRGGSRYRVTSDRCMRKKILTVLRSANDEEELTRPLHPGNERCSFWMEHYWSYWATMSRFPAFSCWPLIRLSSIDSQWVEWVTLKKPHSLVAYYSIIKLIHFFATGFQYLP